MKLVAKKVFFLLLFTTLISFVIVNALLASTAGIVVKTILITLTIYWGVGTLVCSFSRQNKDCSMLMQIGLTGMLTSIILGLIEKTGLFYKKRKRVMVLNQTMPIIFTTYSEASSKLSTYEFKSIKEFLEIWDLKHEYVKNQKSFPTPLPAPTQTLYDTFQIGKDRVFSTNDLHGKMVCNLIEFLRKIHN